MKTVMSLVFLLATMISSVAAYNWQSGAKNVMWARGCDFWVSDFSSVANSPPEKCGDHCADDPQCTHFTWWRGTCYLKHTDSSATAWPSNNSAVCGWVNRGCTTSSNSADF